MNPRIFGAFAGALIFGGLTVSRFERDAAAELRNGLGGPHPLVRVHAGIGLESFAGRVPSITIYASKFQTDGLPFHTEPNRSKRGIIERLRIQLQDFELGGLHVESLDASIPHCRFDLGLAVAHHRFRLSRSGTGTVTVILRDGDLEPFILKKFPEVRAVHVLIQGDRASVDGFAMIGPLAAQFRADASLGVRNGTQLVLRDARVSLAGRPADPKLANALTSLFDPLIDLNKDMHLENSVNVQTIELSDHQLIGKGEVCIPAASGPETN